MYKIGKKEETLIKKMKRSPDKRHTQRHGSLTETFMIEKDICDSQNMSIKPSCVYVCLLSGDLFIFL